ncbi:MAG TPA: ECF transporter S component [Acidimicrobiales bacterium]|jgi:energy-coupling factor transport system substrate-specific component|nr:ECF transporter S component [Acidimicrobiales bacterium]
MTTTATTATKGPRLNAIRFRPRASLALAVTSLVGVVGFGWPLLIPSHANANLAHATDAPWIFIALLPLLLAVLLAEISEGSLDAKAVALLGILAACGAALRIPSPGIAGFEPVFFLLIPAGRVLGRGFGFVLGAVTILASALITGGVGPWLPFQMVAAAWMGFGAGCLPRAGGKRELLILAAYGVVSSLVYGALLNLWFWPFGAGTTTSFSFVPGAGVLRNLHSFVFFDLTTSLGFDIPRAVTTALLVLVLGHPVLAALRRATRRAAFDAPVTFQPAKAPDPPPPAKAAGARGAAGETGETPAPLGQLQP